MNKKIFISAIVLITVFVAAAGVFYWQNLRGALTAIKKPPQDIAELIENANQQQSETNSVPRGTTTMPVGGAESTEIGPLTLPQGFTIEVIAKQLNKPRVLAMDSNGNLWVSEMGAGTISLIEFQDGTPSSPQQILKGLSRPHGLAFDPDDPMVLYYAEETSVSRFRTYSDGASEKIIDLPAGGRHFTRTIGFGPDKRLYVSIGSTCDVCYEKDDRYASMYVMNKDGKDFRLFASGLRNTVFFVWHPESKEMWGSEMGRDRLGDDLPPDEINIIEEGKNYGWPICFGKNAHDDSFDKNTYIRNPCEQPFEVPSHIDLPAHSAPLGMTFIPTQSAWPESFQGDLLVAFHGSWNRSEPTGYKVVRIMLDRDGTYEGMEDFITGWLTEDGALGRPVDLLALVDGTLFVSDDHAGVIYKVSYHGTAVQSTTEPTQVKPIGGSQKPPLQPCIITGCSSQVCAEEEMMTTCEYKDEYQCYRGARCERQTNGECGWTQTPELIECLVENGGI